MKASIVVLFLLGCSSEHPTPADPTTCSRYAERVARECDAANDEAYCHNRFKEAYDACRADVDRGEAVCWDPNGVDGPWCVYPQEKSRDDHERERAAKEKDAP